VIRAYKGIGAGKAYPKITRRRGHSLFFLHNPEKRPSHEEKRERKMHDPFRGSREAKFPRTNLSRSICQKHCRPGFIEEIGPEQHVQRIPGCPMEELILCQVHSRKKKKTPASAAIEKGSYGPESRPYTHIIRGQHRLDGGGEMEDEG